MSLAQLSTELDTSILEHCDHDARRTPCSTSQYWRALSEPFLYEYVHLTINQAREVEILVTTLMKRPELARCIRATCIATSPYALHPTRPGIQSLHKLNTSFSDHGSEDGGDNDIEYDSDGASRSP
jgi:hypothetical protein